jgi:sulfate permease, SulP family
MALADFWSPKHLRLDLIAGLTAAAVVLPKALAYATVAGLPVAAGLYTASLPLVAYALLGTSPVLSVTSTATLAILSLAELGAVAPDANPERLLAATATLSVLTGVILLLASVARLGFVANFISSPVLTGFKSGIGLVILLDQAPKLFGVHLEKRGFFRDLVGLAAELHKTSGATLAVAISTIVAILLMKRFWPRSPAPLVAVAGGILASWSLHLEATGVRVVGTIPTGLPAIAP